VLVASSDPPDVLLLPVLVQGLTAVVVHPDIEIRHGAGARSGLGRTFRLKPPLQQWRTSARSSTRWHAIDFASHCSVARR